MSDTAFILHPPNLLLDLLSLGEIASGRKRALVLHVRGSALLEVQRAVVDQTVLQAAIVYLHWAVAAFVEVGERR